MYNSHKVVTNIICILTKSFCFDIILIKTKRWKSGAGVSLLNVISLKGDVLVG